MLSDFMVESRGVLSFKGVGGFWSLFLNRRCGIVLDPDMAGMWSKTGVVRAQKAVAEPEKHPTQDCGCLRSSLKQALGRFFVASACAD